MKCCVCGSAISDDRLEALPGINTCVEHSRATRPVGFMDFGHKTAPAVVIIDPRCREDLRRAKRAFRRSR